MRTFAVALGTCLVGCTLSYGEPIVLTGKVIDRDGKPVAGARVWTLRPSYKNPTATESDARGLFRLDLHVEQPRDLRVFAVAPGLSIGVGRYSTTEPGPTAIRLLPEAQVRGVVLGPGGTPVEGADVLLYTVKALSPGERDSTWLGATGPRVRTDAEGRFVMGNVPAGAEVSLLVATPGFAHWTYHLSPEGAPATGGAAEDYTIRLRQAGCIEGAVLHAGQPAAGVWIYAQGVDSTNGWDEALTDEQGRYRLERLESGAYNILLDDTSELVAPAHEKIAVAPGETRTGMDFELTPGGIVEGRVVDAETGEPVADAMVHGYGPACPQSGTKSARARADDSGTYRLRVAPGRNLIEYGGGPRDYPRQEGARIEVEVAEGETVRAPDLALRRAQPIEVRVVDAEGQPVPNAEVEPALDWVPAQTTDADGKCLVRGIDLGRSLMAVARDADRRHVGWALLTMAEQPQPVTIALHEAATARLRLVDPALGPLKDVRVSALMEYRVPVGPVQVMSDARMASAKSAEDGSVTLECLPPDVDLRFHIDRKVAKQVEWPGRLEFAGGQVHDLGEVVVDLTTMSVAGVVLLPDGKPARGAAVHCSSAGASPAYTDAEGRFEFRGLAPDRAVTIVAVSADGELVGTEEVVPEWELEPGVLLGPPGRVTGRVVDAAGNPLPGWRVQVTSPFYVPQNPRLWVEATTDNEGWVEFDGLVPWLQYRLNVFEGSTAMPGLLVGSQEFVPEADVDLDLGDIEAGER